MTRVVTVACERCRWADAYSVREMAERAVLEHYEQDHPANLEEIRSNLRASLGTEKL